MKVALIQTHLYWENIEENQKHFEKIIHSISDSIDLIVLPEMFTSGFTMNPKTVAQTQEGKTIYWMINLAKTKKCAITGSLVIEENGNYFNRLVFVFPTGEIQFYDKRHLFTLAGEDKEYTAGKKKLIVEYKGFKICPLVCYDLRFPVFSRNVEEYDVLIYVANWPKVRIQAWDSLLKARAIENMCYTLGVNRMGKDQNHQEYTGHSQAIDFLGNYLIEPQENEGVFVIEIKLENLIGPRNKLGFLKDKDIFTLV